MSAHSKPLAAGLLVGELPAHSGLEAEERAPREQRAVRERRLEDWFRAHFDTLWRLAARLGVPPANADDVVQEAFITAERRAAEISAGSERRFLISTTIKLCANQRRLRDERHESPELVELAATEAPDAEQLLARKQLRQWLDLSLDALPLEQRTVFVLHEIEGFSLAEIAALIEVPAGTAASRLARAREKFSQQAARLRSEWLEHGFKGNDP